MINLLLLILILLKLVVLSSTKALEFIEKLTYFLWLFDISSCIYSLTFEHYVPDITCSPMKVYSPPFPLIFTLVSFPFDVWWCSPNKYPCQDSRESEENEVRIFCSIYSPGTLLVSTHCLCPVMKINDPLNMTFLVNALLLDLGNSLLPTSLGN